jgi:NAD+ kinase
LDELFAAETNVSSTSLFRIHVDGEFKGKFKSSGVIISSGSGSTGWAQSYRKISPKTFKLLKDTIGIFKSDPKADAEENQKVSYELSKEYVFPTDEDKLYWTVRESYSADPESYDWEYEGFGQEIKFVSEMINAKCCIDGFYQYPLQIGDSFTVKAGREFALNCLKIT